MIDVDLKKRGTQNNMPLRMEDLSRMNAFECLWNCCKDHLDDVILTYSADLEVTNLNKKPLMNKITYRHLIKNILKTYHSLKEQGVKEGDVIIYSSITTPELIYTAYASVLLGSIFKPIDVRFNSGELLDQFSDTPAKIFFCAEPFLDRVTPIYRDLGVKKIVVMNFQESLPKIIQLGSKIQNLAKGVKLEKFPDEKLFTNWKMFSAVSSDGKIPEKQVGKNAVIHFTATTGTTGRPKTLLHSSENWNAQLYNASYCGLNFVAGHTFFNCTVPWVDFGIVNAIHTFLCNRIVMNLDPLWKAETNANYIMKNNPHWWMGAPGWLDDLFTNPEYKDIRLNNAKYFVTGGAPLFPHKHLLYQRELSRRSIGGKITPGYGYSEVTAAASTDIENKETTIGKIWPLLLDEVRDPRTREILPDGEEGELWLASKNDELSQLALGYLNNDEENARIFVTENGKRYARSGDKVRKNPDGTYSFLGRYKNILTFNGFNIDCEKIAETVEQVEGVKKTAIFGCVTGDGNQMPVVCVELTDITIDQNKLREKIYAILASKFPDYYTPKDIVFYENFPVISMKTDIQKLKHDLLNERGEYKHDVNVKAKQI